MTGKLLGNRYELIERIDSGGMADIYKARCRKTDSIVAVKILKEKFSDNAEYISRFKKEAEVVFSLEHPNIVKVTDIGNENGVYYIVMEFIEGSTLKALIDKKKYIPENEVVRYALQLCSALSLAHSQGIIHRDIKPQNVLIDKSGNVKLTDFGIAKSVSVKQEHLKQVIGSVHYISPEQARGEEVDASTDIYSLGIMLYEMLTGCLPHTGKTVSVALKHINEQITPPIEIKNDISVSINYIVIKATSKEKSDRYGSIDKFEEDLILSLADPRGAFIDMPPYYKYTGGKPGVLKKKNIIWKIGVLILLVGAAAALILAGLNIFRTSNQRTVFVPNLVGMDLQSAAQEAISFKIVTTYETSETVKEGTIVSQSPQAGSFIANNGQLNLTVSEGPGDLIMPDLTGKSLEDAEALIKSMGLTVDEGNISYEHNQNVPPGNIISQIPEADSIVTKADVINLIVSKDDVQTSALVPRLIDKPIEDAIPILYGAGFTNIFVTEDESSKKEGTVLDQSPNEGDQALFTDEIDITISKYKNQKFKADLNKTLNITENNSNVVIAIQEPIGQYTVNFIAKSTKEETGNLNLNDVLYSATSGTKTIVIYVNAVEVSSFEVEFSE